MSDLVHNLVPKFLSPYNKELSVLGYIKSRTQCFSSPFLPPVFPLSYLLIWKENVQFYTVGSLGQGLLLSVLSYSTMGFPPSTAVVCKDFYYVLSQRPWRRAFRSISPIWYRVILITETKAPETRGDQKNVDVCKHAHYKLFLFFCRDISCPC